MIPYLSLSIWVPVLAGLAVLVLHRDSDAQRARWVALAGALAGFLVTLPLFTHFDTTTSALQFVERGEWIPRFDVWYFLGVDGISVLFVILNSLMTLLVVWAGWEVIQSRVAQYMAAFLIMSGLINGAFAAMDGVLFYVFFEAMLIPMYLIIGIWGGPRRVYAALKFFIYTMAGSVLLLVAILALYLELGSFHIPDLMGRELSLPFQCWVFGAMALSFAVKVPMFPLHTWLPAAHVEAPTAGSVLLASVLLKMGTYGFLRFCLPITPQATMLFVPWMVALSVVGMVYGGAAALAQNDLKKLIAYSSISHMGFVTLGF
ncbi:partial NADH-quinone oxidoreductase subunit M, partial [Anaerolineae bacterium]